MEQNLVQILIKNQKFFIKRSLLFFNDFIKKEKTTGLKVNFKGRLRGVKRARKLEIMKGKIKAQTFSFPVQTKIKPIQTKWGKLGFNVILGKC